jgi:GDP-L-fucose synthase
MTAMDADARPVYRSALEASSFHPDTRAFFAGRNVLVLGGSGFIGSHVTEALIALGAHPVVLSRSASPPFLAHLGGDVRLVHGSLEQAGTVRAAMEGCSVVLHLAAAVAGLEWNAAHPATMFMDNIALFDSSLRAAAAMKVERFLVTSSACVYARHCSVPTPEEEGFAGEPEPTNAGYGWAKRMQEFLGQAAAKEFGLSVAIARPYNAYGPRDDFDPATSHVISALIRKAAETTDGVLRVWGDGSHSRGFLYVDDFARGLIEVAARYPQADALNLGASEEVRIRELAEIIAAQVGELLGREIRPEFDPQGLTGQPRRACDTRKARKILGYEAVVPLETGLRRTIEWYLNNRTAE